LETLWLIPKITFSSFLFDGEETLISKTVLISLMEPVFNHRIMDIRSGNDVRDLLTPRTHFKDEK
jgi:hypothetical protein